jgi:hypothetical protein
VAERVEAVPGIEAAAVRVRCHTNRGDEIRDGNGHQSEILDVTVTTPNYFKAMEIALREGRLRRPAYRVRAARGCPATVPFLTIP